MQEAIAITDRANLIMTVDEANLASELLLSHLRHWQGLRQMSMNANVKRWRFRPKHHYIEHVALSLPRVRLNPRVTSCFQDESFLGAIRRVAIRCNANNVLLRLFQRVLLNLGQRWHDTRQSS